MLYDIFIQKCDNEVIINILGDRHQCKNDSELEMYFNVKKGSKLYHLNFINAYIAALDYNNPINKFFYRWENTLNENQNTINSLNFNPTLVKMNNGFILNKIKEDKFYVYERNDVYSKSSEGNNLYISFCFFLKNIVEYNGRSYKRIQDVISNIGGINQVINIFAVLLNSFYNNYVVL